MMSLSRLILRRWWKNNCFRNLSSGSHFNDERRHWWKTPEEMGEWTSKLKVFSPEEREESLILRLIQAPIDLRPAAIKRWWGKKKENAEIFDQRFIMERHHILGNDLATSHFVLHRGGKVKFCHEDRWYANEKDLPQSYTSDYHLKAVDASNMNIYYEGLLNFIDLHHLKWLSFRNCLHFTDWGLDYISGQLQSVEYLDLQNCKNVTENGLPCLYRLHKLKFLNVTGIPQSRHFHLTCLLLEDILPDLKIEGVEYKV